jgi:hypothetical protein
MRIFWRGERERGKEIEVQRKGGQPLLYESFQLTRKAPDSGERFDLSA